MGDLYTRWSDFYAANPSAKCETCGFEIRKKNHFFTSDDPSGEWDGISCDYEPGHLVVLWGSRRRSIINGFNDTAKPAHVSAECKCDVKDLMSPCGHANDCGYMLNRKKAV